MKIKKIIALCLTSLLVMMFATPLSNTASTTADNTSLYDFLKNTENIDASYKYPSMKIAYAAPNKRILPAHTPVPIRCEETITTKDVVSGGTVNFSVVSDIKDANGIVLIKAGTPVTAQITFARSNAMIGRSGELTINDFHTTAVDGTYVPLSGSVSARPDDKMTISIVLSVLLCPLFLLMKGDEAQLNAGSTKNSYTVADIYVTPQNL